VTGSSFTLLCTGRAEKDFFRTKNPDGNQRNCNRLECNVAPEDFAYLSEKAGETVLRAYIQPRASRSEFSGTFRQRLKIRISSPPVEGEANRECIDFLAKTIGVSKSDIKLLKGGQSREKTFVISRPIGFVREKLKKAGPDLV